jgi:hypothetical protein
MPQIKRGPVAIEHDEEFKKDVTITRGEISIAVPMELLRVLVAESIRRDLAAQVAAMKPVDLLRRLA